MKKFSAAVLAALVLTVSLSACGQKPVAEPSAPPETPPVTTQAPVGSFTSGTLNGGTYKSAFLRLSFTPPEGWSFADADELGKLMGASGAVTDFENYGTVYDMSAASETGGKTVRIGLDNLSVDDDGSATSVEEYAQALETSINSIGIFESIFAPLEKVTVAEQTFTFLHSSVGDTGGYQDFLIQRVGDYILCIAMNGVGDDSQPLWQYFSAFEQ